MGANTNIEWCDTTVNPTTGCEGCELWNGRDVRLCYAGNLHETRLAKALPELYDENFQNVRHAPGRIMKAANLPDLRGKERPDKPWMNGLPRMIFVGDMGDFASKSVSFEYFRDEVISAITSKPGQRHFWLLLTKQIHRLAEWSEKLDDGLPDNCMAMTTVTSQATVMQRVPALLDVKCQWRGISAEPLKEAIKLFSFGSPTWGLIPVSEFLHWVIVGGLSGSNQWPLSNYAVGQLQKDCEENFIPFFFKQWGQLTPYQPALSEKHDKYSHSLFGSKMQQSFWDVGKEKAGRELDGVTYNQMPRSVDFLYEKQTQQ